MTDTTTQPSAAIYPAGTDDQLPNVTFVCELVGHAVQAAVKASNEYTRIAAQTAAQTAVDALWPYVRQLAEATDPDAVADRFAAAVRVRDEDRQHIISEAVERASAAAMAAIQVSIPDVVRVEREGTTEIAFKTDSDGRIVGATAKPKFH